MKVTYKAALKALGVVDFELKKRPDYDRLMHIWRDQTVQARENGDDVVAAHLSQCKEAVKTKWKTIMGHTCPRCGGRKYSYSEHCPDCVLTLKGQDMRASPQPEEVNPDFYHVSDEVYIPPPATGQRSGELTLALRNLIKIGDSFLTNKSPTSVQNTCKVVGIKTIVRKVNLGETDKKKKIFRVWRSDGLKASEVNKAIKVRLDAAGTLAQPTGTATPTPVQPAVSVSGP